MLPIRRRAALLGFLCLLLSGCGSGGNRAAMLATATAPMVATMSVVATPTEDTALPAGCHPAELTALVERFLAAFNSGDQAQLRRFFLEQAAERGYERSGQERFFHWYSVSQVVAGRPPAQFTAYTRDELLPYLARRHTQNERLQLRALHSDGRLGWHGGADVTYELAGQADDVPTFAASGKGAIDCRAGMIFVWSMGIKGP